LLADLYHASVMGEDIPRAFSGRVDLIGHVHIADHPERHEPGTGGVDWHAILALLAGEGYDGYVGLEYMPTTITERSMAGIRAISELVA